MRNENQLCVGLLTQNPGERPEENGLVLRPGRARYQGGRSASQAEQWIVRRNSLHPRDHAIETRIAQNLDPIRSNAQLLQPERIIWRDRSGYGDGAVPRFQQPPSQPAKTTAARAYRGGDEGGPADPE